MTVRTPDVRRVGAATRRLATLGVVWAATGAITAVGCSHPTASPNPSAPDARALAATASVGTPQASHEPGPVTTPPPTARLTPVRISVPAIGVDAPLVRLGLTSDGALAVPTRAASAGWYTGSPVPGRVGPAVIAGHVHWSGVPGVFAHLADLAPGDRIVVARSDGTTATFAVDRVTTYPKTRFPTALVYGSLDVPGLRLITCGGYDPAARAYEANVIVFATSAA
jgi:sortase (surface protein transpeptidase)